MREEQLRAPDWTLISRIALFADLEPAILERLLESGRIVCPDRGTRLFTQNEPASHFYVILTGWVKLFRLTADGRESIVHVFTGGESFAEAAILGGGYYPVCARVETPARLLAVPAEPFLSAIDREPAIARNMLAAMSRHLRQLVATLEQLQARSASERLAAFLLELIPSEHTEAELRLPVDKALIAARLGMQPATLSRTFSSLRGIGVRVEGERVRIADVGRLRELTR